MPTFSELSIVIATALALSSTPAVMQHLADKKEVETRAGKITIATLLSQELWAVVILSYLLIRVGASGDEISFSSLMFLLGQTAAIFGFKCLQASSNFTLLVPFSKISSIQHITTFALATPAASRV
mgnify:CR=1 FL=1